MRICIYVYRLDVYLLNMYVGVNIYIYIYIFIYMSIYAGYVFAESLSLYIYIYQYVVSIHVVRTSLLMAKYVPTYDIAYVKLPLRREWHVD